MVIGFIYKIYDNTSGSVYYGSTKNKLSQRMATHRSHYKTWCKGGKVSCCKSFDIIKNGDYAYSLVEQVEYENKMELLQRERWYIENNECVNKLIPARSIKEWNEEFKKEYDEKYREEHKDVAKEYHKIYYEKNREQAIEKAREYSINNKERVREYKKKYQNNNRDAINAKARERKAKKKAEKNAVDLAENNISK